MPARPDGDALRRPAAAIAASNRWEVEPLGAPPAGGHAALVSGDDLTSPAVLWLRREALDSDADARHACSSDHVTRVIRPLPDRRSRVGTVHALLLEHPGCGTLEDRLGSGPPLRVGEAVTILVGVATALSDLHAAGWGGALPRAAHVAFRADGCPVLAWLQRPVALDDDAEAADRRAFRALSRVVCDAIPGDAGRRLLGTIADVSALRGWERIRAALLREAQPEVVTLTAIASPGAGEAEPSGAPPNEEPLRDDGRPPPFAERILAAIESRPLRRLADAARERVRRRPGLVAAALAPVILAILLLALLPTPGDGAHGEDGGAVEHTARPAAGGIAGTPARSSAPSEEMSAGPSASPPPARRPSPAATLRSASGTTAESAKGDDALRGDDPVSAALVLLERRHACFSARSPSRRCLEALIQPGSQLLVQEEGDLGRSGAAAARDPSGAKVALVQRWARAAVVTVGAAAKERGAVKSEPASLLLVRSEAGWRLREVFP